MSLLALASTTAGVAAGEARIRGEQSFRIIQTTQPEFPMNVDTMALTSGEARIVFNIDHEGRLLDEVVRREAEVLQW